MITRFSAAAIVAAAVSLTHTNSTHAAEHSRFDILHHERMASLSIERRASASALAKQDARAARLRFQALGRAFDLALEPNDRLLANLDADQRLALGRVELYRGALDGEAGSWARVSVRDGQLYGLIWDGAELYAIEPAAGLRGELVDGTADASDSIIFRLSDVQGSFHDEAPIPAAVAANPYDDLVTELQATIGMGATRRLDIGLVADVEFSDQHPDAEAELLLRANYVDGIFSDQLGLQINVTQIVVHTHEPDPFSTTDPSALLSSAGTYRSSTPALRAQALVHLFTGRELDTTTVGIAYVGGVCDASTGVGLTEASDSVFHDALIAAHEVGHNLGARHDAEAGSPCESTPSTYLMAPQLNGSDTFSQCSVSHIASTITHAGCLAPAYAGDVRVSVSAAATALLGDDVPVRIVLDNLGRESSANVLLAFRIDAGAEIEQPASAAAPDCAITDGELRCTIGAFAAGARAEYALELRGTRAGALNLEGTVYASNDTNVANNVAVRALTLEPAVVLLVGVQPEEVALGRGGTAPIEITLANDSVLTATDVAIEISSPFELTELAFAGGACEAVAAATPRYRCAIGILRSSASQTLTGVIHAPADVGEGQVMSGLLSATATAAEPIAQAGSNSASAVVQAFSAIVDLESTVASAPASVKAGANAHIVVKLHSLGPDAAPDARLHIDLPTDLALVDVADDRAACAPDGNDVSCEIASLAEGETIEVEINVLAQRAGTYAWSALASHAGLDPNGANDSSERTLQVNAPPSTPASASGGGGGGGGASWMLLAIAAFGLRRQRRRACAHSL